MNMMIGQKLRELREKKGISMAELGALSKITPNHIYVIEKKNKNVSINTLQKLATALGVHITDLFPPKTKEEAA